MERLWIAVLCLALMGGASAAIEVAEWYPKGGDYVFICTAEGLTPASYDWNFGDGDLLFGMASPDVYHTFSPGTYTVQCTARAGGMSETSSLSVVIGPDGGTENGDSNGTDGEICYIEIGDFRTQTQGGWGSTASGGNPGAYRDANFAAAFPGGVLIGLLSGNSALFNSSAAVEAFLPAGGTAGVLTENSTNPLDTDAGVLAGQVLTLALSIGFDENDPDFGNSSTALADLIVIDEESACYGMTVQEVLDEGNAVLGGAGEFEPSAINDCLSAINENFVDGTDDNGYLGLLCEQPYCGDGTVDRGEQCDGSAPEGYVCTEQCALVQGISCEEAVRRGLLRGSIEGNIATVVNDAGAGYTVGFASYERMSSSVSDQELFDSDSGVVAAGGDLVLEVAVPGCFHQLDLFCGEVLVEPEYGARMIASVFVDEGEYCVPSQDEMVALTVAPWFPQERDYVFVCEADFNATEFNWYFGDGEKLLGLPYGSVYHTYGSEGNYTAACTAIGSGMSGSATLDVTVGAPTEPEAPEEPEGPACGQLSELDASCSGGVIVSDTENGCRTIVCEGEGNSLTVLACEKPDTGVKQYFELYRTQQFGAGLEICVEGTCISENGFARSPEYACVI